MPVAAVISGGRVIVVEGSTIASRGRSAGLPMPVFTRSASMSTTHTAVLKASGRETQGPGTVEATVVAALTGENGATAVALFTDLTVTGRVAQFGGGVMTEVADRLLVQFTERLEADLGAAEAQSAAPPVLDLGPTARRLLFRGAGRLALVAGPLLLVALRLRRRR